MLVSGDQVLQNGPRANRGQLIDIAHQKEVRIGPQTASDLVHQPQVNHRGLVDDQHLLLHLLGSASAIGPADAQVTVHSGRGATGRGSQLLRRTARGGAQRG